MNTFKMQKINFIHFGKKPYHERHLSEEIPFDPDKQIAVIKCSICTYSASLNINIEAKEK